MNGASGEFVGREAERALLADFVRVGVGDVLLVAGPAGIGKTRLLVESLRDAPVPVAWGTCWDGDGVPPFWPWSQVLRAVVAGDEGRPEDAVIGLRAGDASSGEATRFAMFERVVDRLRLGGGDEGLIVVLDDLHWADEPSLRLLTFAVRSLRAGPVRFVGAYRDEEVGPAHPLSTCIGDLGGRVRHLRLEGLGREELGVLASAHLGEELAAEQLSELHALTGGNPFFAREVLALARGRGSVPGRLRIPPAVRAVIEQRLARLSSRCDDVLKGAAVIGSEFAADDLAAALETPLGEVLGALDEATAAGVIVADEVRPGSFRFAHDLLRETIYDAMPPAARAASHARLAAVLLEARGDGVSAATLAHHLAGAVPLVDRLRAVEAARRAAEEATRMLAHEDAAAWLTRALVLLRREGDDELEALRLLLALGDARRRSSDLPGARDAYLDAAGIARRRERPHDLALAALGLGAGLGGFEVGLFDRVQIDLLEEALGVLDPGDSALRARLLARLSVALSFVADDERRGELAAEAVAMARRLGDPSVLGYALAAHCDTIAGPAHAVQRREQATEILAVGLAAREPHLELLGRRLLLVALLELGDMVGVDAQIRAFSSTADVVREPLYRWYVPLWQGMRALMAGRIDEAAARCEEAAALGALADSTNAAMLTLTQRWVRLRVEGKLEAAARLAESEGARVFGSLVGTEALRALSQLHLGEHEQARALLRSFTNDLRRVPIDAEWLPTIAQLAEAAAGVGDADAAAVLDETMAPYDDSVVVEGIGAAVYGTLGAYRAPLARLLGREEESQELERAAAAAAERMGLVGRPQVRAPQPSTSSPHPTAPTAAAARHGDTWELRFGGATGRVRDGKGLRDLVVLLANPGAEVHVSELNGGASAPVGVPAARGDDVLDQRALAEYKRRLDDIDAELAEAESHHDEGRVGRLHAERELLLGELAAATGLGGRPRRLGDDVDRQRKAVWARLHDAIGRIEAVHPELGRHLARSVRTGTYCAYDPEVPVAWTVRP